MAEQPEETTYGDYQAAVEPAEHRFKQPLIHKARPADRYAASGESIYEFTDGHSGGLIALARNAEDKLVVDVYRTDDDVVVRAPWTGPAKKLLDKYLAEEKVYSDLFDKNGDLTSTQYAARDDWRAEHLDAVMDLIKQVLS